MSGHADGPLDRDPTHQPGVQELLAAAAGLPNPFIGLVPVFTDPIRPPPDCLPLVRGERSRPLVVEVDRVHELAIDVELQLTSRVVPDPYRSRAAVTLEISELPLSQVHPSVDAVHDLQWSMWAPVGSSASGQEVHEGGRLALESELQERVDAEGCVPYPDVAVVPVAFTPDLFRKAGRGGGEDRAGRGVGQQLERQGGPMHHLPPPPSVARCGEPVPPEAHRRHQLVERLLPLPDPELGGRRADLLQGEDGDPALLQGELGDRVVLVERQGLGGTEVERKIGRSEEHTVAHHRSVMGVGAVVEPGCGPHAEGHRAPYALHPADQALWTTCRRVP